LPGDISPTAERMAVGTVLRVGHPANNVAWIKTGSGWILNDGRPVSASGFYDTIEHGAFEVLVGG
jgi:hypothetical protein